MRFRDKLISDSEKIEKAIIKITPGKYIGNLILTIFGILLPLIVVVVLILFIRGYLLFIPIDAGTYKILAAIILASISTVLSQIYQKRS